MAYLSLPSCAGVSGLGWNTALPVGNRIVPLRLYLPGPFALQISSRLVPEAPISSEHSQSTVRAQSEHSHSTVQHRWERVPEAPNLVTAPPGRAPISAQVSSGRN